MTQIIIPEEFRPGRSNPLREFLQSRNGLKFKQEVALADALSLAVTRTAQKHRMRNPDVLNGLLASIVSCVQAMAPENEWASVGEILADELRQRLTVTGVS